MGSASQPPEAAHTDAVESRTFALDGRLYWLIDLTADAPASSSVLTRAERAVLAGLITGLSARDIARERAASIRTVERQIGALYRKLHVSSRAELLRCVRARP